MNRPGRTPTTCVGVQRVSAVASALVVEIRRCGGCLGASAAIAVNTSEWLQWVASRLSPGRSQHKGTAA
jgi:hypothetical protein